MELVPLNINTTECEPCFIYLNSCSGSLDQNGSFKEKNQSKARSTKKIRNEMLSFKDPYTNLPLINFGLV